MSRIIELTTTITLRIDETLAPEMLRNHVRSRLKAGFGEALSDHPMAVRLVAVRDPDGDLFQAPYIRQLLAGFGQTAIVWSVHDVLDIRPDLTHEQATEVLQQVIGQHDAHHGICRDDFESMATELYGDSAPDPDCAEVSP